MPNKANTRSPPTRPRQPTAAVPWHVPTAKCPQSPPVVITDTGPPGRRDQLATTVGRKWPPRENSGKTLHSDPDTQQATVAPTRPGWLHSFPWPRLPPPSPPSQAREAPRPVNSRRQSRCRPACGHPHTPAKGSHSQQPSCQSIRPPRCPPLANSGHRPPPVPMPSRPTTPGRLRPLSLANTIHRRWPRRPTAATTISLGSPRRPCLCGANTITLTLAGVAVPRPSSSPHLVHHRSCRGRGAIVSSARHRGRGMAVILTVAAEPPSFSSSRGTAPTTPPSLTVTVAPRPSSSPGHRRCPRRGRTVVVLVVATALRSPWWRPPRHRRPRRRIDTANLVAASTPPSFLPQPEYRLHSCHGRDYTATAPQPQSPPRRHHSRGTAVTFAAMVTPLSRHRRHACRRRGTTAAALPPHSPSRRHHSFGTISAAPTSLWSPRRHHCCPCCQVTAVDLVVAVPSSFLALLRHRGRGTATTLAATAAPRQRHRGPSCYQGGTIHAAPP